MKAQQDSRAVRSWLAEPLTKEVEQSLARLADSDDVRYIAVMPDVHLAKDVCVGAAVATRRLIYPQAVGADIGCGMTAIQFDSEASVLADERNAAHLLTRLYQRIPSLRHSKDTMPARLPEELSEQPLTQPVLEKLKHRDGRVQLGTLGRGNHFLEFQSDDQEQLWLMVHSGSRAMGQAITDGHLQHGTVGFAATRLRCLDADTPAGRSYLADVEWALKYATANRQALLHAAVEIVSELIGVAAVFTSLVDVHHNHVRREVHFGEQLWVHRKGASSAPLGEPGLIPGSMGTASYHVEGRGCEPALCSSSHGAGRAMSRTEAAATVGLRQFHRQMHGVWFDHRQADRLRDEAPAAYKDIQAVMRAQRDLVRIVRILRPVLSFKGS